MANHLKKKTFEKKLAGSVALLLVGVGLSVTNQPAIATTYEACASGYTDLGNGICEKVYDYAASQENPNFSMPTGVTKVDILVVGGGGGAGGIAGNNLIGMTTGAGGGELILCLNQELDPNSLYTAEVGAGGKGSANLATVGMSGENGADSFLGSCRGRGGFGSAGSIDTVEPTWGGASGSGYGPADAFSTYGLSASGYIADIGVIGAGGFGGSYKTQQHSVVSSTGESWYTGLPFQPRSNQPCGEDTCYFAGDGAFGESPAAQTPANPGLFASDVNWYGGGGGGGVTSLGDATDAAFLYAGKGGNGGGGQAGNFNGYYKTKADSNWPTKTGQPGTDGLGGGAGGTSTVGDGDSAGGADGGDGVVKIRYRAAVAVVPTVTGISPTTGSTSGGTTVTITGTGFTNSNMTTLSFGGVGCTPTTFVSSTQVTCVTGAHAAGSTTLERNGGEVSGPFTFTYAAVSEPTVTGISPTTGSTSGGTTVTITGTGFTNSNMTTLSFGGVGCTPTTFVSSTQVTCVTGAHAAGSTTLERNGGEVSGPFTFTYAAVSEPTVTGISPTTGSTSGGTTVTITGTGFTNSNMTTLSFGGVGCTPTTFVSSTQVTCVTGAHAAGSTTLERNGGEVSGPFTFTYAAVSEPTVTGISPTTGPTSGGTTVTITGTGFAAGTTVVIGGVTCSPVTVVSATSITCVTASSTAGLKDIVVTNSDSGSVTAFASFRYTSTASAPTAPIHFVSFDPNGGSGNSWTIGSNSPAPLPLSGLSRKGYVFSGWNTKADGSGTAYADQATYSFGSDLVLYAQWSLVSGKKLVKTFAGNKATVTPVMKVTVSKWVKKLPKNPAIVCQGSTSGSKITAFDKKLAASRAKNVCAYAVKIRKDLSYKITVKPSSSTSVSARHVWMNFN